MNSARSQVGWRFFLLWVLASTVGVIVGHASIFALLVMSQALYAASVERVVVVIVTFSLTGAINGASIGIAQWLVLRRQVTLIGRWVLASTVGGALGYVVGFAVLGAGFDGYDLGDIGGFAVLGTLFGIFAVFGASVGVAQWLILRRREISRAGWWVFASSVGDLIGVFFLPLVAYGVATGVSMLLLLWQPVTKEEGIP